MKSDYADHYKGKCFIWRPSFNNVNKNLNALNTAYELHLKNANEQMKSVDDVYKGLGGICNN